MSAVPNGGVQGPFPGATTALQAENERLTVEVTRLQEVLATASCEYVDCVCPGCPRKVPRIWRSGTCEPCAAEDCEHTDGARGVAAERDELQERCRRLEDESNEARRVAIGAEGERDQARAEVERLRGERGDACDMCQLAQASAEAERDRLRAVLAETPENLEVVAHHVGVVRSIGSHLSNEEVAAGILAALRARAAAAPTEQAGGAQSGSAGPPGGLGCPKHPEHLCVAMVANMPGRPSGLCVYGCAIDNGHPPSSLKPAFSFRLVSADGELGARELMRVMNGVTPDDLRAQGFPDVAAALERRR